jgi:antitoxin (DNA-binding transcriptional repressor) of toxin-antitoxin stability system
MAVVHISESDAARDFPGLLDRVRAGDEIVIEREAAPAVLLRVAAEGPLRRLSESLRLAKEHASEVTLDGGFAGDLELAIESHPESLEDPWG